VLYVLSLDTRGRLLGAAVAVAGGISAVQSRAADVFREALICDATSIVIAHNHPSGDPTPSPQDVAETKHLIEAGKILGVAVEDHLIVGQGKYISLRAGNYVPGWLGVPFPAAAARPRKPRAPKTA
jgi:DNA repair protein RadC